MFNKSHECICSSCSPNFGKGPHRHNGTDVKGDNRDHRDERIGVLVSFDKKEEEDGL